MQGSYLELAKTGELERRAAQAKELLRECRLCPRQCRVDRLKGEQGFCRTGRLAEIASYGPHFGEESPLVGEHGSGTIFFCGCNLLCVFCQNYDISHPDEGSCSPVGPKQLGALMVGLQEQGCHNINFVTPTHVVPQLLDALVHAVEGGLTVPLVYNSGGYDRFETLRLLAGVVDIYMPDFKFWESSSAARFMDAPDYREVATQAIGEMQRQVGDLQIDSRGIAVRGLLVRHLLMPGMLSESEEIFKFLAEEISTHCYLNVMDQYRPCGRSGDYPELLGTITADHYRQAVESAQRAGLTRLDQRDFSRLMNLLLRDR